MIFVVVRNLNVKNQEGQIGGTRFRVITALFVPRKGIYGYFMKTARIERSMMNTRM